MVTLDQKRESLDPGTSVQQALVGGPGDLVQVGTERRHVVSYMKDFLFHPDQARTAVGVLSGGERGRLMLARALAAPSNLLVLDEPTNDLDIETLDLLQELLADYPGTVLLVSHDRDFIDRVCTSVIVAEGEGRWQEYAGGYSDMVAQRGAGVAAKRSAAAAAAAPPRDRGRAGEVTPAAPASLGPAVGRPKLSFTQTQALAALPGRMEALGREIAQLQVALAVPDLYTRDPARFDRFTAALVAKQAALDAAEQEWLELELLREEAEAS
jgi:ATP-binding cassette subfamily F protein uup